MCRRIDDLYPKVSMAAYLMVALVRTYAWQPLLPIPHPLACTSLHRPCNLAYARDGHVQSAAIRSLEEHALGDELRLAVACPSDREVADGLFGYRGRGPPVVSDADGGGEENGDALRRGDGEVEEIADALDVRREGREGQVEVNLPLSVWCFAVRMTCVRQG